MMKTNDRYDVEKVVGTWLTVNGISLETGKRISSDTSLTELQRSEENSRYREELESKYGFYGPYSLKKLLAWRKFQGKGVIAEVNSYGDFPIVFQVTKDIRVHFDPREYQVKGHSYEGGEFVGSVSSSNPLFSSLRKGSTYTFEGLLRNVYLPGDVTKEKESYPYETKEVRAVFWEFHIQAYPKLPIDERDAREKAAEAERKRIETERKRIEAEGEIKRKADDDGFVTGLILVLPGLFFGLFVGQLVREYASNQHLTNDVALAFISGILGWLLVPILGFFIGRSISINRHRKRR